MGVYRWPHSPATITAFFPMPDDSQYLDYGPLMAAKRGKKWVLEPHASKWKTVRQKPIS